MLWYCSFTWYPHTTRAEVARRVVQQHDVGANYPERIVGWYNLVGGGAGFPLIGTENPEDLTAFLQPYMDLMSWDVRAATQLHYEREIANLRKVAEESN
jgi:hypothetical protein